MDADVDVEMGGAETPYGVGADARLESRVASISAEFRAAFADAGVDEDGEEEDEDMGGDSDEEEGEEGVAPRGGAETTVEEVGTMLAEALLTLANLTEDVRERGVLYARAQREGGDAIVLDELDEEDGMEV